MAGTSSETSKERYERARAARRAREERTHAEEVARSNARNEILARKAAESGGADDVIRQAVLAPPDPTKSSARQLGRILGLMLLITVVIGIIATIAAATG
ncbi:hypothetical protein [Embleya sp. NBC_00896]|uniref:hypothetical protein n=1 Tax=Embleya sp. NBC_00896 TaxID=2975961 RepID=UPI00386EAAAD|nr:hypothetical protein OG928_25415 [Embleya sp. NBC_00896]